MMQATHQVTFPAPLMVLLSRMSLAASGRLPAYELLAWYTDGKRRPVSPTSAMTSKVKGQGLDITGLTGVGP